MQITVKSNIYPFVWFCSKDPSGDFRSRLFSFDAVSSQIWDDGVQFVNLQSGELRTFWDGHLHIDFLFDPCCPRGSALYADYQRVYKWLPSWRRIWERKPMLLAYKALNKHTRSCKACRAMLEIREIRPVETGQVVFIWGG